MESRLKSVFAVVDKLEGLALVFFVYYDHVRVRLVCSPLIRPKPHSDSVSIHVVFELSMLICCLKLN